MGEDFRRRYVTVGGAAWRCSSLLLALYGRHQSFLLGQLLWLVLLLNTIRNRTVVFGIASMLSLLGFY